MMTKHTTDGFLHLLTSNNLTLLRLNTTNIDSTAMSKSHSCRTSRTVVVMATCTTNEPLKLQIVKCLEEVLIVYLKLTLFQTLVCHPYILVAVLYLVSMRIQTTVRSNDTITVEVIV